MALGPVPAWGDSIRLAGPEDLPAMIDLLIVDARQRSGLDPRLWPIARDARVRIDAAVQMAFGTVGLALNELWLLAEASGRIVGMAHAMFLPVPPIYRAAGGLPGLILDDCFTVADAPAGTMEALLRAKPSCGRWVRPVSSRLVQSEGLGGRCLNGRATSQ